MLASFDELVIRCIDDNSRSHIREAIRCYEAGAYRSSIVATYIAVCFDLIEKLRFLAAAGDAEAQSQIDKLEEFQKRQRQGDQQVLSSLLKFEKNLPILFRDTLEFFGTIEYDDILRLITDRNRCAHPTFLHSEEPYRPSAEVARLHIRNALDLVLTQEPRQGKAALKVLKEIITSKYFPKEKEDVKNRLKSSPLKNPKESLIKAFIDDAVFGTATKGSVFYENMAAFRAVEAVIELHPSIAFNRVCVNVGKMLQEVDPKAISYGAFFALRSPEIAHALPDSARSALKSFVTNPVGTSKANALAWALNTEWLRDFALSEVSKLTSVEIKKISRSPQMEIVNRAVDILVNVKSFDEADEVIADIDSILKHINEDHLIKILTCAVGESKLIASDGFYPLIKTIFAESKIDKLLIIKLLKQYNISEKIISSIDGF